MKSGAVPYDEFAEVALTYLNQLYITARRLTRNAVDAEDCVQETYRLAFEHYRELRSLAHCRAWMYRILQRQAVSQHRRDRQSSLVVIQGGAGDEREIDLPAPVTDDAIERLSLQEIRGAIDALPADLRTAVTLCDIEGFSYEEIARITDAPVGTVRSRIARARAKLMTQLHGHAEACGIVPCTASPTSEHSTDAVPISKFRQEG
jgi:RNA polymerase sigma-70 factor (ECF subfamily)